MSKLPSIDSLDGKLSLGQWVLRDQVHIGKQQVAYRVSTYRVAGDSVAIKLAA